MKYNLNSQFINLRLAQVNFLAGYQFIRSSKFDVLLFLVWRSVNTLNFKKKIQNKS